MCSCKQVNQVLIRSLYISHLLVAHTLCMRSSLRLFSTSVIVCFCSQGLLWQLRPSDVEVELLAHTRNVISKDLEEETGLHTGWIQNGGLFIASNKQRLDEYKRLMSVRVEIVTRLLVQL